MPAMSVSLLNAAGVTDMPSVYISIGSNIDRSRNIRGAVAALQRRYGKVQLSSVYETEAVGFSGDPFYNLVAQIDTEESIDQVVAALDRIEEEHGRLRGAQRYQPRTLDLDLLLYGDMIATGSEYSVPRAEITRYAFVLSPLAELAPQLRHPQSGETCASLWAHFDKSGQALARIAFDWERGAESVTEAAV